MVDSNIVKVDYFLGRRQAHLRRQRCVRERMKGRKRKRVNSKKAGPVLRKSVQVKFWRGRTSKVSLSAVVFSFSITKFKCEGVC